MTWGLVSRGKRHSRTMVADDLSMEEGDNYVEYVPVAKRRALTAQMILQRRGNSSALEDELEKSKLSEAKPSLKASQLKRDQPETSQTEQIVQRKRNDRASI
ncbi:hypothetical protein SADUNF_SadunfUnG0002600 [Salix dunnii]|uniref:Uncharacterized protein n=1 Tax=Salix dunnii TaxID=1413687 RepID=A0A835MH29_9ROSI|nr:hypothetical protein SADUNF_SadunfUnG0002600 [Salix dunnii]